MKTKTIPHHGRGVNEFMEKHADKVTGVVSSFDRLRLRIQMMIELERKRWVERKNRPTCTVP